MEMIIKNLGLEENEAKIYQALLELGPSTVSQITKKAEVSRTLGYQILEKLSLYGLVDRASAQSPKIHYVAEHPGQLVQFIKNRKNQWARKLKKAEEKLPELISLYKLDDKPTIKYQEGLEGIKTIYIQSLESKKEIISILDIEGWDTPELKSWGKNYNKQRSEMKIHERVLIIDTPRARSWMKNYHGLHQYTHYRWIKEKQLSGLNEFGGELNVYEDKVIMALLKKPNQMGIMIQSQALANILKGLFELAWQQGINTK